jgi:hypothetical protein
MTIQQFLRILYQAVPAAALTVPVLLTAQQQQQPRAADHFPRLHSGRPRHAGWALQLFILFE